MLLPITQNFTKLVPTSLLTIFYISAFYLLTFVVNKLPIAIVYATWSGLGIFTIAILGYIFFKQTLTWQAILGLFFIVIGVVSSLQQICLAYSLKLAPASLLAPLRYISVPIGILIGVYLFNESLTSTFYIGTLIIISSSLIIIRRETQKKS